MSNGRRVRFLNPRYFGDSPEGPVLVGSKCKLCGCIFFPRKTICTKCLTKDEMQDVQLSKKGKLHSYTVSYRSHIGLKTPFAAGYIELPEKVRIYSVLSCSETFDMLKIGMEMEMIIDKLTEDQFGYDVMVYKFRPVG